VLIDGVVFAVPTVTLLLIGLLSIVAYLWLAMILLRLRNEPSLQDHSAGQA
jgi:hypothetical protein